MRPSSRGRSAQRCLAGVTALCCLISAPARAQDAPAPTPTAVEGADAVPTDRVPVPDRWRIELPDWDRRVKGRLLDPYNLNPLKGDYPIRGTQDIFFVLTAVSDTLAELRRLPTGESYSLAQQALVTLDLYRGSTAYKPVDWEVRFTLAGNLGYLDATRRGVAYADPARGTARIDSHLGVQEAFGQLKLADVSPHYDVVSLRLGIQGFTSDFRGFVFSDQNLGARLFGNLASNRYQWNLALFDHLQKDTNSGLNTLERRNRQIGIANLYLQDFAGLFGYTLQLSYHYNRDRGGDLVDANGFPVRPAAVGAARRHRQDIHYLGVAGDGHIGRINLSHAFYQVLGDDTLDPIAGRPIDVDARLAALELSIDQDWMRYEVSALYQSGDGDPADGKGRGFDAVLDNVSFAGGPFSFFNHQRIRLAETGVSLTHRNSPLVTLRSSREEGMSEFVNPGLVLAHLGATARVTPRLVAEANASYLWLARSEPLESVLERASIPKRIGLDLGLGVRYRPWLDDHGVIVLGAAALFPGAGLTAITGERKALYQAFTSVAFTY